MSNELQRLTQFGQSQGYIPPEQRDPMRTPGLERKRSHGQEEYRRIMEADNLAPREKELMLRKLGERQEMFGERSPQQRWDREIVEDRKSGRQYFRTSAGEWKLLDTGKDEMSGIKEAFGGGQGAPPPMGAPPMGAPAGAGMGGSAQRLTEPQITAMVEQTGRSRDEVVAFLSPSPQQAPQGGQQAQAPMGQHFIQHVGSADGQEYYKVNGKIKAKTEMTAEENAELERSGMGRQERLRAKEEQTITDRLAGQLRGKLDPAEQIQGRESVADEAYYNTSVKVGDVKKEFYDRMGSGEYMEGDPGKGRTPASEKFHDIARKQVTEAGAKARAEAKAEAEATEKREYWEGYKSRVKKGQSEAKERDSSKWIDEEEQTAKRDKEDAFEDKWGETEKDIKDYQAEEKHKAVKAKAEKTRKYDESLRSREVRAEGYAKRRENREIRKEREVQKQESKQAESVENMVKHGMEDSKGRNMFEALRGEKKGDKKYYSNVVSQIAKKQNISEKKAREYLDKLLKKQGKPTLKKNTTESLGLNRKGRRIEADLFSGGIQRS